MRLTTFTVMMIIAIILPSSAFSNDTSYIDGEINALKVLEAVYGQLSLKGGKSAEPAIWHDIKVPSNLRRYLNIIDGEVYIAFEAKYIEKGTEKYLLLTQTRPLEGNHDCHACAPLIGGFVFAKSGDRWVMENQNKYIDVIGLFGWIDGPKDNDKHHYPGPAKYKTVKQEKNDKRWMKLVSVGTEKHGVLIHGDDMHQGYESNYFGLIIPYRDGLVSFLEFIEGATEAACEDEDKAASNEQGILVEFQESGKAEYYNINVTERVNVGRCGNVKSLIETKEYEFKGGTYTEIRRDK